jgi:hypothetical protein
VIICVYALIGRAGTRLNVAGVTGEPLRTIAAGHVAAVAGEVRRVPAANVGNLRRYAAVVDALASRVPAVLPARFGTVIVDPAELTFILRSRAETFRRNLRHVRGRSQMTIHLFTESDHRVEERADAVARVRRAGEGTQYLQRKRAQRVAEEAIPSVIEAAARRYVKDQQVEHRSGIIRIHHLRPRAMATRYRAAVERAAAAHGMRVIVTGPWPAYAFAAAW